MDLNRFSEVALGRLKSSIKENVIISPVFPIKLLKNKAEITAEYKGKMFPSWDLMYEESEITFIYTGIGAQLAGDAVMMLEESPCENIYFLGTCGGLNGVSKGNILIAEKVINGEGFSRYHGDKSFKDIVSRMECISTDYPLSTIHYPLCRKGTIFTTGSLFIETKDNLELFSEMGIIGIEMELSAVYTAAKAIGKNACGILPVTDLPQDQETAWSEKGDSFDFYGKAVDLCLGIISGVKK